MTSNNNYYCPSIIPTTINIVTAIPLLIMIPIVLSLTIKKKGWHLYYRTILLSLLISILLTVIGTLSYYILYMSIECKNFPNDNKILNIFYSIFHLFLVNGPSVSRISFQLFAIERICATLLRKKYENKSNIFVAFILFLLPYIYGLNTGSISNISNYFKKYYFSLCILLDFITIIISIFLWYLNIKMRSKKFEKSFGLSEKYQLNENVRLIKLLLPLMISYICVNLIFNFVLNMINLKNIDNSDIIAYNSSALFIIYICCCVQIIYQCNSNFLYSTVNKFKNKKNDNRINDNNNTRNLDSNKQASDKEIRLQGTDGNALNMNYDQKSYFKYFATSWL